MNSEFQIMRWGIPGWIFFMTIFIFKLTVVQFDVVTLLNSFSNPAVVAGFAAFFAALGVPLGYVLYQVYYGLKWWTIKTKTVTLATEGIDEINQQLYDKSGLELWYTIEGYFDTLMTIGTHDKKLSYKDLVRRYNSFSNRTSRIHGLGASVLAMIAGFVLFFITTENRALLLDNNFFIFTFLAFLFSLIFVIVNYRQQNKYSFKQLNQIMKDILEAKDEEKEDSFSVKQGTKKEDDEEEEETIGDVVLSRF
ncbi:hypothetical protein [Neobacillus sp. CF12]|uniref:hypothetical protein n=1 Tax=Neobacillus sp. CF12 TaxID=3055864 RepID=UPI0025A097E8|nr:hypothetical protein [Neobacillus sp. CF12]MDM5326828.1 hypothetical protein [Neobacillus sp. CF12]